MYLLSFGIVGLLTTGIVLAAFGDTGKLVGSTFSVGSADLKFLANTSLQPDDSNLVDELPGPSFTNIGPAWTQDYVLKLYNKGTSDIHLASNANYETANDVDNLRQDISIELIPWDDANSDGIADATELGTSLGIKTIIKWKTEGYDLGVVGVNQTYGLVLRFSTASLSDTKQGASAIFDYEFDSIGL